MAVYQVPAVEHHLGWRGERVATAMDPHEYGCGWRDGRGSTMPPQGCAGQAEVNLVNNCACRCDRETATREQVEGACGNRCPWPHSEPAERTAISFIRHSTPVGIVRNRFLTRFPLWSYVELERGIPGWGSLDGPCEVIARKCRRTSIRARGVARHIRRCSGGSNPNRQERNTA